MIAVESGGSPLVVSEKGALGLMQIMPETYKEWYGRLNIKEPMDAFNADQNRQIGTAYIEWLLKQFGGDVQLALAAYNCGIGNTRTIQRKYQGLTWTELREHFPKETQKYVPAVLKRVGAIAAERGLTLAAEMSKLSAKG